ncbi:MAG: inner membrane-spanning protein YciB [Hyphomicrobium sp.]|uniref:inner membrane-spanning protein YciB n=1 Tax=Hyphomicrobium sp. TaxID=82 RepID=UPI003D0A23EB
MSSPKRLFPFNAEQTINILSEFGPLVTMFVVNALYGINAGTWALIITTIMAIVAMVYIFHRPPVFPLIASTVTIAFGSLTLITHDPMWVQIKVTIFNALFAGFLFSSFWHYKGLRQLASELGPIVAMLLVSWLISLQGGVIALFVVMAVSLIAARGRLSDLDWVTLGITAVFVGLDLAWHDEVWLKTNLIVASALAVGFALGAMVMRENFFQYVFEKTFHYTQEGWDLFTRSFAWFFVFTAVANEVVRLTFKDDQTYDLLGLSMTGVDIWIAFKLVVILPLSGLYAWLLTKWMSRYHL